MTTDPRIIRSPDPEDEINLYESWMVLWRFRRLIFAITSATTIACLIVAVTLPKIYVAEATILPTSSNDVRSAIAGSLIAQLGPAAGMLGGLGGGKTGDLQEILKSRTLAARVVATCQLEREFKGPLSKAGLVSKLKKMTMISAATGRSGLISIKVEAPRPELVATIANAYVTELKVILDEIGYSDAARNRQFISRQLAKTKEELRRAEERLATFQTSNQLSSLPDTVVASIRSVSELEAQRINTGVQLKTLQEALAAMRSKVRSLQVDPNVLADLEIKQRSLAAQQSALERAKNDFLANLSRLPPKAMALARLQRDVQVQNALHLALSQQYESAIIDENKESDAFLPLDKAEAPERPSKPRKIQIVGVGFVLGATLSALGALAWGSLAKGTTTGRMAA